MQALWLVATALGGQPVTPIFGVEARPFSRADLVWVDEGRTSGTAVGEFDGTARALMSAFGGLWFDKHVAMVFGLGLARTTSTSQAEEVYTQLHWGVLRPSLDLRFGWAEQRLHRPVPWFVLGVYGDVPSARNVSNGYTTEEQDAADTTAASDRARLGGVGVRGGFGADYRLLPGLMIGLQATVGLHRSTYQGGDATWLSVWVATEASVLLTFEWPPWMNDRIRARRAARAASEPARLTPTEPPSETRRQARPETAPGG